MDLKDLTDKELNIKLWDAVEIQNGWLIRAIKNEMSRRYREA